MRRSILAVTFIGVLSGCVTVPDGPSVTVMPAPGKPFDMFVVEDRECRQYAQQSIGKSANQAATDSAVESIAVGTAIGAVAGTAMGGHSGAGTGAAVGILGGAAAGSDASRYSGNEAQRRYDIAYEQCMYAKGNQLPSSSPFQPRVIYTQPYAPPPPPPAGPAPSFNPPPPPPGQ